jgi:hypothetical protein
MSKTDAKAKKAIELLMPRRAEGLTMGYGELGAELPHPERFLGGILDRVGTWCYEQGKQSLALLVVDTNGKPRPGLYKSFRDSERVTPENYEDRLAALLSEDWTGVKLPDETDIAEAYDRRVKPNSAR